MLHTKPKERGQAGLCHFTITFVNRRGNHFVLRPNANPSPTSRARTPDRANLRLIAASHRLLDHFAYSSQTCAACGHVSLDNRPSEAEFVCLRCGHADNADHNAAVVIAARGVQKLLSGEPLTVRSYAWGDQRKTPAARSGAQRSMSQEPPGAIPETSASAS
ncbi:MAG: zinc ribbon domain-containing protein [Firmicutes bacterium]|nr:zinc ribbon domain-containing protein [Bacillota bacterium]